MRKKDLIQKKIKFKKSNLTYSRQLLKSSLMLMMLLILFGACNKDDDAILSSKKQITAFSILQENGAIDETSKTIGLTLPYGTDVSSLSADVVISAEATISPASGVTQDFSNPVTYIVTAQDGSIVTYIVTVSLVPPSSDKIISSFLIGDAVATIDEASKEISCTVYGNFDISSLTATLVISDGATVSPVSDATVDFSNSVTYTVTAEDGSTVNYNVTVEVKCANPENIYSFIYNSKNYEVVKENKTWEDAAACAAERGGYLAEINDANEQDAIYSEVMNNASITASSTIAPDGGGASYIWLGGNDLTNEGAWFWDGNNDDIGVQFWQGTTTGNAVNGLYNNWGNEPDNWGVGQDGLGLAITNWPLGVSGQWNDVKEDNELYFVIEFD